MADNKNFMPKRYLIDNVRKHDFPFNINIATDGKHDEHWHDFNEVTIVLGGTGQAIVNYENFDVCAGDVFINMSYTIHGIYLEENGDIKLCSMGFTNDFISGRTEDMFAELCEICHVRYDVDSSIFKRISELVELIDAMYMKEEMPKGGLIATYFEAIICELYYSTVAAEYDRPVNSAVLIQDILKYINDRRGKRITVSEIAEYACMSRSYFNEYFQKNCGIGIQEYIKTMNLRYAGYLLLNSELPIDDIALESGYNTSSGFYRAFRGYYHVSPGKYRETYGKSDV